MDFKVFYFNSELDAFEFVDRFWDRIFNVRKVGDPDVGETKGWEVRVKPKRS